MIMSLLMAKKKKQIAEGYVTADEYCHSLSVLNQVQKDKHEPV